MLLRPLTLLLAACLAAPAYAAESYDNCTGFIDTLPVTLGTQGVWCLRKNLATALSSGTAITVAGNNITIDCNEFKIGGLAGGPDTAAYGIRGVAQQNTTVRNCGVRGFAYGIYLDGGAGHLVEDNRLDNNVTMGIFSSGDYSLVQRNRILDMGGNATAGYSYSLVINGEATDNLIAGASGGAADFAGVGIAVVGNTTLLRGNRISGLETSGSAGGIGIWIVSGQGVRIENNHVRNYHPGGTTGIAAGSSDVCLGNSVVGYASGKLGCTLGSGDVVTP